MQINAAYSDTSSQTSDTSYNRRLAAVRRYISWIQVFFYMAVVLFAIFTTTSLTLTQADLDWNCPLYSYPGPKIVLTDGPNNTRRLRVDNLLHGDRKTCLYSTYLNLSGGTYALVWGILLLVLSRPRFNKKRYIRKLLFPSLLFNSVLFTSEVISSCVLTLGFTYWCRKLREDVEHASQHEKEFSCQYLQALPWDTKNQHVIYMRGPRLFALLTFAQFSSWILTFCTFVLAAISGERFYKSVWFGESHAQRRRFEAAMEQNARLCRSNDNRLMQTNTNGNMMKSSRRLMLPGQPFTSNSPMSTPPICSPTVTISKQKESTLGSKSQRFQSSIMEEQSEALLSPTLLAETVSVHSSGFHGEASPLLTPCQIGQVQNTTNPVQATSPTGGGQSLNIKEGGDEGMEMISTV